MTDVLLAILILVPAALTYLLKSNAALAFLALCGGFAAITLSGGDIKHLLGQTRINSLTSNNVDIALLAAPLLLTLLFAYRSVPAKGQRSLQLIPALCAGGLLAVIAGPMFNGAVQADVTQSAFWSDLQRAQPYILGVGLLASLLLIWFSGARLPHKKHK
ncbi:MAG TPA: hypothetical protein VFP32_00855 [Candidatus Saccharimonadales bacterium]|nr:hypothetical protein [Candidatus Saccharimonadales bacterium]